MIRHIVCFKLKEPTEENCREAARVLSSMRGQVEEIIDMEVGVDFLHSARSYDVILQVTLADREALDRYQNAPYHVNVVKNICTPCGKPALRWITRSEHKNAQGGAFPARRPLDPLQNLSDKKKTAAGNFSCNAAALLLFWVYTPDRLAAGRTGCRAALGALAE